MRMRRITGVLTAALLTAGTVTGASAVCLAAETETAAQTEAMESTEADDELLYTVYQPEAGVKLVLPESFREAKGAFVLGDTGVMEMVSEPTVTVFSMRYIGMDYEGVDELYEKVVDGTATDDETAWAGSIDAPLFTIFGIDGGRGVEELTDLLDEAYDGTVLYPVMDEIGSAGDFTFFFAQQETGSTEAVVRKAMGEEFYEEYEDLLDREEEILAGLTLSEPLLP